MKRLTALVLVFAFMLSVSGCKSADELNSDPTKSVIVNDSLILVQSNGELAKPYRNFLWAESWSEHGWLCADGWPVSYKFSEIYNEIPQIVYSDDFEIHCKDGVELRSISVYNSDFEEIYHNIEEEVLTELSNGIYFLVIDVKSQGKYIEAEDKYEYAGYECAYKMIVSG